MSRQAKKSYINISELINNFQKDSVPKQRTTPSKQQEEDKENRNQGNRNQHTRPSSQTSAYDTNKIANEQVDMLSKTMKIDKRTPLHIQQQKQPVSKRHSIPSIYDSIQPLPFANKPKERGMSPNLPKQKLQMLQSLITSQKMFIDPQRWQSFLQQAQSDQKFHRALSAFLYSYFIQNYQ